jgi:hypothetical protein
MIKVRAVLPVWLAVAAFGCGSSEAERRPYVADPERDAGRDSAPHSDAQADAANTDDAPTEAATDGGTDAGPEDATIADQAQPDALPDSAQPSCAAGFAAAQRSPLGISTGAEEHFGSISDDQLTLAFSVDVGGSTSVFVAERTQGAAAFQTPVELAGDFALDRVALTPDGLSLIALFRHRRGFIHFAREARDQAFEPAASSQYDAIVAVLGAGERLGDPVFALGGQVLFYSQYGGDRTNTVRFANRLSLGSAFDVGGELSNPELRAQGTARRRPSGVSADYSTLFFFDEVSGTSKAATFAGGFDFGAVADLGVVSGVMPNSDCSTFYFDAPGATSRDLFSAR